MMMNEIDELIKKYKKYVENSIFYENNDIFLKKALSIIKEGQRLEDLQLDGHCIIQNPNGYCFTSDSVLLANFCNTKSNIHLLELCAGCGVISVIINAKNKIQSTTAVELQPSLFELCKKNLQINCVSNATCINDDLSNYEQWSKVGQFDCVVCNPPYEKTTTSSLKINDEKSIARAEVKTTFNKIAKTVSKVLKFGGEFYFLSKAERLSEILHILIQHNLQPKIIQFIYEKPKLNARLFMCKATLGGKSNIQVLSPITRCNEDGTESEQVKKIYGRSN